MGGGSPLGNLVVGITVNTLGLSRGLANALALAVTGFGRISMAALESSSRLVQALGLVGKAASLAIAGVVGLVAAFDGLARAGASLEAAGHNAEQVFGSWSKMVKEGADAQAAAFGQSKDEYLSYAATIGRELQKLGVGEDVAARQATALLDAVQRLAQSRRISFGEAFAETRGRGELFTEAQVRGYAVEIGLLRNRNQMLNAGAEALARNRLAVEAINETTENTAQSGDNWNSQVLALQGNLSNLAGMIGAELLPTFVSFLQHVNDMLEAMIANWAAIKGWIDGILVALGGIDPNLIPHPEAGDVDARNAAHADKMRKREAVGEAFGRGGGGSGAGFQGGLVEFARRVQGSAFNQRQIGLMERQLKAAEDVARNTAELIRVAPWKDPKREGVNDAPWF